MTTGTDDTATAARNVTLRDLEALLRDQQARKVDIVAPAWAIRCLAPTTGTGPGAARACLSDGYKRIDNLDVLPAALDGVRQAGSRTRSTVVTSPNAACTSVSFCEQVRALAPALLDGYRSPFTGAADAGNPVDGFAEPTSAGDQLAVAEGVRRGDHLWAAHGPWNISVAGVCRRQMA
ncbi:MAG TPA: hypothetical protein VFQ44_26315 [Streptosporangiaceae bacterium]|nr:hypothetical protein [Streptosporangiaceae bacterium]